MGYTTEFKGRMKLSKPLTESQFEYLCKFSNTRRMKRDPKVCEQYDDPLREEVGLPIGSEGEYTVFGLGWAGQDRDLSVVNGNTPPDSQFGLWCQWVPSEDHEGIEWNGGEKFYSYFEWLAYIHENFLIPWDITFKGVIHFKGEERGDSGRIKVVDNSLQCIHKKDGISVIPLTKLEVEPAKKKVKTSKKLIINDKEL